MSNLAPILAALDFAETHLKEKVAVADMARAASYSLYHFCRVFNRVVHHSPYDYLMRRRLSESARELVETDRRIIDIALDYQFSNPESYSRAFKRMFDLQPSQWQRQGILDPRFLMARPTRAHLQRRSQGTSLQPALGVRQAFRVAGVMTLLRDEPAVIDQLWDVLAQELEGVGNRVQPERYYGIVHYPERWLEHGVFYMAGVEIESPEVVGASLVVRTIPQLAYARFVHKGRFCDRGLTLDYAYQTWLPKSGKRLACPLEIECYGPEVGSAEDEGLEREIYIPIE
jgi:AraC family transcriptional regulator